MTEEPRVVNRRTYRGPGVYIGRPGPWGNPFIVGPHGDREAVIRKFRRYLRTQPALIERARRELRGRTLICWCAPLPCHGDVLVEIANPPTIFPAVSA